MANKEFRLEILRQVEAGTMSLETAAELLGTSKENTEVKESVNEVPLNTVESAIEVEEPDVIYEEPAAETVYQAAPSLSKEDLKKPSWAFVFWVVPLLFGALVTVTASSWLYNAYTDFGLGFRFWFSWIPFLIGIALIYLGFVLQNARWLYIHVRQPVGVKPARIFLGFPVPLRFLLTILSLFRGKMPAEVQDMDLEGMIGALENSVSTDDPIMINVDDEDGTKVEIYLG